MKIFSNEFRTIRRIFTNIDNELYQYIDGEICKTLRKANLNEDIKVKVWGT